ncbi:hypothetical protein [Agathobacter rectalis]|jgi:hypothetical protein|uniref:hypothetical protein n=1 Tax=Agathobacter rectalis TaxID=39491 RepID=UPI0027D2B446|nr:hypothetical protein [Agathobacter rectalis]MCB7108808.1 hypothetical protein [Agathobacter rectalis]MCG4812101.1 hypothetical protein [Agathobacter rectalis]
MKNLEENSVFKNFMSIEDIKNYVNNNVERKAEYIYVPEKQLLFSIMVYVFEHIDEPYQNMETVNKFLQMSYLKDNKNHRIFDMIIVTIPADDIARKNYINVRENCDEVTYNTIINNLYTSVIKY